MTPFTQHTGMVVPLDRANVDTDQNPQLVKPGPEGRVPPGDSVKGS